MNIPQAPVREPIQGNISIPWLSYFSKLAGYLLGLPLSGELLGDYVNDAAAAAGGVPLYGYYRTASVVKQRVV